jgi:hypothetical protein
MASLIMEEATMPSQAISTAVAEQRLSYRNEVKAEAATLCRQHRSFFFQVQGSMGNLIRRVVGFALESHRLLVEMFFPRTVRQNRCIAKNGTQKAGAHVEKIVGM